jgi:hypothetical protein
MCPIRLPYRDAADREQHCMRDAPSMPVHHRQQLGRAGRLQTLFGAQTFPAAWRSLPGMFSALGDKGTSAFSAWASSSCHG